MELFTRDMVLFGPPAEVRTWAVEIAEAFEEVTEHRIGVWMSLAGGTAGHVTWSMPVDGIGHVTELMTEALADAEYRDTIEAGRHLFRGSPYDTLYRPYEDVAIEMGAAGAVCMVTRADAAPGQLGDAVGWGLETAHYVTRLTEVPTTLFSSPAGHYSRLTWLAVATDARAADAADRKSRADDGYRKLIARGGPLFTAGSARSQWFQRIA